MCQLFCIYIATGDKCVKSPFVAAIESFSSAHDFFFFYPMPKHANILRGDAIIVSMGSSKCT